MPNEVLERIGAFLGLSDRIAVACSCKRLYEARWWQNGGGTLPSVTLSDRDLVRAVSLLESSALVVGEIVFEATDLQREHIPRWKEFWRNRGPNVVSLEFRNCDVGERVFVNILDACPRLRRLAVDDCNGLLMSGKLLETRVRCADDVPRALLSLRALELRNNRYLSDALFNRWVSHSEHLEELSLAGCQISFHRGIFKRFYPNGVDGVASESVLTFQNLMTFLERQSSKLRRLDLSGTSVDDDALGRLAGLADLRLRELNLARCNQLTGKGIEAVCEAQTGLSVLDVTRCRRLDDGTASLLASRTPRLESLTVAGVVGLTHEGGAELAKLDRVSRLDLSACTGLDSADLRRLLCAQTLCGVRSLDLSSLPLRESDVIEIVGHLAALRQLDLSSCGEGVTDAVVHAISEHCRWLRALRLAWCTAVTDFGLTGRHYVVPTLSRDGPRLLDGPPRRLGPVDGPDGDVANAATSVAIDVDASVPAEPLHRLRGLRELDLCGCSRVSDVGLKMAVRFLELTAIDLSQCHRVTDGGLVALGASNKSLERVVLNHCREITDEGLVNFAIYLPRLRRLDIRGCHKIGNVSLDDLRKYCPYLRHLEVSTSAKPPFQIGTPFAHKRKPV